MSEIQALIQDAGLQMHTVDTLYNEALATKTIGTPLKLRIKGVLDQQRAVLDHLAYAVHAKYGTKKGRTYYPLARKREQFADRFDQNLPGVREARPDIAACIEHHQPYELGYQWMIWLNGLCNENKHRQLSPVSRVAEQWLHIRMPDGRDITFQGSEDARFVDAQGNESTLEHHVLSQVPGTQKISGGEWAELRFAEPDEDVIAVLLRIQTGVAVVASAVSDCAELDPVKTLDLPRFGGHGWSRRPWGLSLN